jgi:hypothetical protein
MAVSQEAEVQRENKKIRRLRLMVDLTCALLHQGRLDREESWALVEGVKRFTLTLFPGREETFEIVYRSKFRRIIEARHPLH